MKCTIQECNGEYEERYISQVFTRQGVSVVIERIPALVCNFCGDTILQWETTERLWEVLEAKAKPERFLPAYTYQALNS